MRQTGGLPATHLATERCFVDAPGKAVALHRVRDLRIERDGARLVVKKDVAGDEQRLVELGVAPQILAPRIQDYAWGGSVLPEFLGHATGGKQPAAEAWLTSPRKPLPVSLVATGGELREWIEARPEILGEWSRRLHGDRLPIFLKILSTRFPARVHLGFHPEAVAELESLTARPFRETLREWMVRERDLMKQFHDGLLTEAVTTPEVFERFRQEHERWVVPHAEAGWSGGEGGDATFVEAIEPMLRPREGGDAAAELRNLLAELRETRARMISLLNEVDLRDEIGNLLLCPSGAPHAIFGLSHQVHPQDPARAALAERLGELRQAGEAGASVVELASLVLKSDPVLDRRRGGERVESKSEAWLPFLFSNEVLLAEPQEVSDTTFSWLDIYTPFKFEKGRMMFRKGEPESGITDKDIDDALKELEDEAAAVETRRRTPREIEVPGEGVRLFEIIDDPAAWPTFTLHRLELDGNESKPVRWKGDHPPGAFQQLMVIEGEVNLSTPRGEVGRLDPGRPVFVPATAEGGYTFEAAGKAVVLLVSVPTPWSYASVIR